MQLPEVLASCNRHCNYILVTATGVLIPVLVWIIAAIIVFRLLVNWIFNMTISGN